MIWYIVYIITGYFFLVFFVLRLTAPFMGFRQPVPVGELPGEMRQAIAELEVQSQGPSDYLQKAFKFVLSRWYAERHKAVTELPKLFRGNLQQIWQQPGYAHCTTQNFILYTLLVNSRFFKPDDIRIRHVFLNFVPHQYMKVRVEQGWIDVDPAAVSSGITVYGKHGSGIG